MSYNVKNTAGNTVAIVPDRFIDHESTSIALVGFNSTSYGLDHAQNFVKLMEHFANDVAPDNPIKGQIWYDTTNNNLKVNNGTTWTSIAGPPSIGGDSSLGGIAGVFHCHIASLNTSILLLFSGGRIVAVMANRDIEPSYLPATVNYNGEIYALQAQFALGLQGGINLADSNDENNPDDFVFNGRVPLAEQAHFAGGGVDDGEVSGWGYLDIGPGKSVGLMISGGQVVCAVASAYVLVSELPSSMTFYVKKDRDSGTGTTQFTGQYKTLDANYNAVTCAIRPRFPGQDFKQWTVGSDGLPSFDPARTIKDVGLLPGLTFAQNFVNNGSISQTINSMVVSATSSLGTAIAKANTETRVWVDERSANALKITELEATFKSKTGATSLAGAIDSLFARASDTGAVATAITNLKAEFNTALGAKSFSEALTLLQTTATASGTTAQAVTKLTSTFTDTFGGSTFAEAVSKLSTAVDDAGKAVVGYGVTLNNNGYVTGIEALNGGSSNNYFKVTSSNFIIGDNNIDFIPFSVKDGAVYIKNALIENLSIGGSKIAPGLSKAFKFQYPDQYITSAAETVIIETPYFSIGDETSGSAVAFLCYLQDSRSNGDSGQTIQVFVDTGNGYQIARVHSQQGFRTYDGDTFFAIPVMFPVTFSSTKQCRMKVTAIAARMPGSNGIGPSYCRNTEIHVFQTAR